MTQDENWGEQEGLEYVGEISAPKNITVEIEGSGVVLNIDGELVPWQVAKAAPEMLAEMEKLAQALEDTGFEPEQSFYDVIKKARGM